MAEGERGGHVIGHTKTGKPIYGSHSQQVAAVTASAVRGDHHVGVPGGSSAPKGREKTIAMGDALSRRYRVNKGGAGDARGINKMHQALDRRAIREDG